MKKSCFLLLVSCFCFLQLKAQEVLLHEEVTADTITPTFGPNYRNFLHSFMAYGATFGGTEGGGTAIRYGNSGNFLFGLRYKYRVSNFFSWGADAYYSGLFYAIKQDSVKAFPDTLINDKERLTFHNLSIAPYLRFNLEKKRGNRVGNFIDLGAYGEWTFRLSQFTKNKLPDGRVVRATTTGLDYYNSFNYGAMARLGFNRWIFFASWRFSNLFKASKNLPELPRLIVGVQIGFY
jgi:hypothetical protein